MEQIETCTDCRHYNNCSFKRYIDNPYGAFKSLAQLKAVVAMAPKDCPRFKESEFVDVVKTMWLCSVLASEEQRTASSDCVNFTGVKPHRMPCEEDR